MADFHKPQAREKDEPASGLKSQAPQEAAKYRLMPQYSIGRYELSRNTHRLIARLFPGWNPRNAQD